MTSRIAAGAALALLLGTGLTACGGNDQADSVGSPTTHACRSYVLLGGADDQRIAIELQQAIDGVGGFNVEETQGRLAAVQAGAAKAGLTENLPTKDYRRFAAVVEQAISMSSNLQSDNGAVKQAALTSYKEAVSAVGKLCD